MIASLKHCLVYPQNFPKSEKFLGNFSSVLRNSSKETAQETQNEIKEFMKSLSQEKRTDLLEFSVACLQEFVLINFCGLKTPEKSLFEGEKLVEDIKSSLVLDGEDVDVNALALDRFWFARTVLSNISNENINWVCLWWRLRSVLIHVQILTDHSEELHAEALEIIQSLDQDQAFKKFRTTNEAQSRDLAALYHLEVAQFYGRYYEVEHVKTHVEMAQNIVGMEVTETGALGRRTKYQQFDLAQMTLDIASSNCDGDSCLDVMSDLPVDIKLDDEVRLDRVKFKEEDRNKDTNSVSLVEQCILLARLTFKQRLMPKDSLTNEELMPYLNAVLSSKTCWSLKTSALLIRSKLESEDRRAVERSMMQVQALVDPILNVEDKPISATRLISLYASRLPPNWEMQKEFVSLLLKLGSVKSALDIALRLQLWEDVIDCYHTLQLRHKAAEVIQAQIDKNPTALLYCMLGDATDDIQHYHKALEMTNNKSARAYRSLGVYYYFRKDYQGCVDNLKKSLELNAYQMKVYLRLGYAALQIELWAVAADAYRKYCAYESDNFEAWNNLSNAYLKQGDKLRAFRVLGEAIKCDYGNWKIWENILIVAMDLRQLKDAFKAYHMIMDLKAKHLDPEVIQLMTQSVTELPVDQDGKLVDPDDVLKDCFKLFGRISVEVPSSGVAWECYGDVNMFDSTLQDSNPELQSEKLIKAVSCYQKASATLTQKPSWEKSAESCLETLKAANKYGSALCECEKNVVLLGNKTKLISMLSSCKMTLKSALTKVKTNQMDMVTEKLDDKLNEPYEVLEKRLKNVEELLVKVKS